MGKVLGALLLAAVAVYALKLAFLSLILAGLIFRTRQTLGLLAVCAAWALFWKAPVISCALIALVVVVAIYKAATKNEAGEAPPPLLTDETGT